MTTRYAWHQGARSQLNEQAQTIRARGAMYIEEKKLRRPSFGCENDAPLLERSVSRGVRHTLPQEALEPRRETSKEPSSASRQTDEDDARWRADHHSYPPSQSGRRERFESANNRQNEHCRPQMSSREFDPRESTRNTRNRMTEYERNDYARSQMAENERSDSARIRGSLRERSNSGRSRMTEQERSNSGSRRSLHERSDSGRSRMADHERNNSGRIRGNLHERSDSGRSRMADHERNNSGRIRGDLHERIDSGRIQGGLHERSNSGRSRMTEHERNNSGRVRMTEHERSNSGKIRGGGAHADISSSAPKHNWFDRRILGRSNSVDCLDVKEAGIDDRVPRRSKKSTNPGLRQDALATPLNNTRRSSRNEGSNIDPYITDMEKKDFWPEVDDERMRMHSKHNDRPRQQDYGERFNSSIVHIDPDEQNNPSRERRRVNRSKSADCLEMMRAYEGAALIGSKKPRSSEALSDIAQCDVSKSHATILSARSTNETNSDMIRGGVQAEISSSVPKPTWFDRRILGRSNSVDCLDVHEAEIDKKVVRRSKKQSNPVLREDALATPLNNTRCSSRNEGRNMVPFFTDMEKEDFAPEEDDERTSNTNRERMHSKNNDCLRLREIGERFNRGNAHIEQDEQRTPSRHSRELRGVNRSKSADCLEMMRANQSVALRGARKQRSPEARQEASDATQFDVSAIQAAILPERRTDESNTADVPKPTPPRDALTNKNPKPDAIPDKEIMSSIEMDMCPVDNFVDNYAMVDGNRATQKIRRSHVKRTTSSESVEPKPFLLKSTTEAEHELDSVCHSNSSADVMDKSHQVCQSLPIEHDTSDNICDTSPDDHSVNVDSQMIAPNTDATTVYIPPFATTVRRPKSSTGRNRSFARRS